MSVNIYNSTTQELVSIGSAPIDALNSKVDIDDYEEAVPFSFGIDGDTYGYYKEGSSTLTPFAQGGGGVKLGDVAGASVVLDKTSATITWSDPNDITIESVPLAVWKGTKLVRKTGSAPTSVTDGTLIINSITKNQYSSSGYVDTGLTYGTTYYYRFFPYTEDNLVTNGTSINVTPARTVISTVPSQSEGLPYNGEEQTATFANFNSEQLTVTGNTGTNVGEYTAHFTPKSDYCWSDGTQDTEDVVWEIVKADASVTLSSDSVTLDSETTEATVTVTNPTGAITVSSSDSTIATASYENGIITITSPNEESGEATITVSIAGSSNYNSGSVTISVSAEFIKIVSWASGTDKEIKAMIEAADEGKIDLTDYWEVGDTRNVSLSAMAATGVGESHVAQTVEMTLVAKDTGVKGYENPCYNYQYTDIKNPYGVLSRVVTMKDLPIGAKVRTGLRYNGVEVDCLVIGQDHDAPNSTTFLTEKIITLKAFDAKEPNNSDSDRAFYGNNRYSVSNIRQWLNSIQDNWFSAQHEADEAPSSDKVSCCEYDTESGFLYKQGSKFVNNLINVTKTTALNTVTDGGGFEITTDKIFLLSETEVGLGNENRIAEGSLYSVFTDNTSRLSYCTSECINNSNYASDPTVTQGWYWWLRTPSASHSLNARYVTTDGSLGTNTAYYGDYGVRPAFCLPSNLKLHPTTDGAYVVDYDLTPDTLPTAYTGTTLADVPVGSKVVDLNTTYYSSPIEWMKLEDDHDGEGTTTLLTEKIICLKAFDAKEPNNSDSNRKSYGNNRWAFSNINQWLNSEKQDWYKNRHSQDQTPNSTYVTQDAYDSEVGFLSNLSYGFKKLLKTTGKLTAKNTVTDSGGSETIYSKIFLLSETEVGLGNENNIAEGTQYTYFNSADRRKAYATQDCIDNAGTSKPSTVNDPWYWWLRTPYASNSYSARRVNTDGSLNYGGADRGSYGVRPACVIPKSTPVTYDETNSRYILNLDSAPTTLKDLPVGAVVKDTSTTYYGDPINWEIIGKNHDKEASVTLLTEDIISMKAFDAKESSNPNSNRASYGNNRWSISNIRQWLNSGASAGNWYSQQHPYDAAPNSSNVWQNSNTGINPYDAEVGFLNGFGTNFKNLMRYSQKKTSLNTVTDSGGYELVNDKIFLLSNTEIGLTPENSIIEGVKYDAFNDDVSRLAYCDQKCIDNSNYASDPTVAQGWYWWLRTPYASYSDYARLVNTDGSLNNNPAYSGAIGVRPACVLPDQIHVNPTPDSDGVYTIDWSTTDISSLAPQMTLGDVPIGSRIQDPNTKYYGSAIDWLAIGQNHDGDYTTTLLTEKIISLKAFDAKETGNSNSNRQSYGNNRWGVSNLRQWLNSDAAVGEWYQNQHAYDVSPSNTSVVSFNEYADEVGFLNGFSSDFKSKLQNVSRIVALNTVTDGGGNETNVDKLFLLSNTEVGLANENSQVEGSLYNYFLDNTRRVAKCTSDAISHSSYSSNPTVNDSWYWWLRTPSASYSYAARIVYTDGSLNGGTAYFGYDGVRPACILTSDIPVTYDSNSDTYILDFTSVPKTTEPHRTYPSFIVQQKNGLANGTTPEYGYMNSSNTNSGGWASTARRTWCNKIYKSSMPSGVVGWFKRTNVGYLATYNGKDFKRSEDYFFFPAEKEVFNTVSKSSTYEACYLSSWYWYNTSANRLKKAGTLGSANNWWERSSGESETTTFCLVSSSGSSSSSIAQQTQHIAPAGCI